MKKQTFFRRHTGRRLLTAGLLGLMVLPLGAQEPYRFDCHDYVMTDAKRAPQSAFTYDDAANTFTITATGQNNIAFAMDSQKDGAYYIDNTQDLFLVRGTDLGTASDESYIWWFNGYNRNGQTPPTYSVDNGDGTTLVLWDIRNTADLNANMDFTQPVIFISSGGNAFIHSMGLTSSTGTSTISDVNYYAGYEAAATYPALISTLGYTAESLTGEIKGLLNQAIAQTETEIADDADTPAKAELENAIAEAQSAYDKSGATDYAVVFAALNSLHEAADKYTASALTYSYEQTDYGIRARLNDQYVHLMLYADNIVRVVKSYSKTVGKKSLSVTDVPDNAAGLEVTENTADGTVALSTAKVKVLYHLTTGQVEVLRYNGAEVLREKEDGTSFIPVKDGPYDSYRITSTFQLDDDEQIYGMGQIQDGLLNHRGQTFSLAQNNMKVCIPYFQSTKEYALFWDNYSPTTFTDNAEGTRFQSTGTEVDYYVMVGDNSDGVLAAMRELTGKSPMLPLWNFGLYQSKERYTSTTEVMDVVDRYRALGVPLDCVVQDWQYWGDNAHWNALAFLNPAYSNAEEMIGHVHDQNARLMISIWANFGPQTEPYAELNAQGRLIPVESYPQNCGVRPYDVYDENSRNIYWKYLYDGLISKGIDAYWMDSTEPDYFNWQESDLDYVSGEGRTWRSLRNAFPIAHVGGVASHHRQLEAQGDPYLSGKRVSILTRSAFAGQQRYGANTWSGDVTASWQNFAAQIPAACNLSVCGIPYWNSDIGGFFTGGYGGVGDPNWRRLYMRWMQFGTFTPMMRFHGTNTPREIWQFGSAGDGTGDYDQILKYVRIRYRLLPYLYATAWQVCKDDATFMRALPIAFGHDRQGYGVTDEYMFGEAFLVAPVVQDAVSARDVYLPEGTAWTDFWTGEQLDGGQTVNKRASMDIIPLYVRAGSILPWGPDVQYSGEKPWNDLEIRVYPGADGSFTLYEDEGDNYNYENGAYAEIPFTWDDDTQTLTIGDRRGQFDGMLTERTFRIVKVSTRRGTGDLHATQYDAVVNYNGTAVEIVLDSEDRPVTLTDITADYIQNPSFEADGRTLTQQAPQGWTVNSATSWWGVNAGGGNGDPVATDGTYIFGVWDASKTAQAEISQTISGLPAGSYRLTVDMHAANKNNGSMRVGNQRLFAGDHVAYFKEQVLSYGSNDMYPLQTISLDFTVADGDAPLTIGVTTSDAPSETWFKIDNFRLYTVERPVVELSEETAYAPVTPGQTDVRLTRQLKADGWNTLCLPFSLSEEETAAHFSAVKVLTDATLSDDSYDLNFTDAACIEAGVPCLVKPAADYTELLLTDALFKDTDAPAVTVGSVTLHGTYNPLTLSGGEFVISNNMFYRAEAPVSVKGYRAYVTLDEPTAQPVNSLRILIDGESTDIADITADGNGADAVDVYSLTGILLRRGVPRTEALSGLPHGTYIVGGEKVLR